MERSIGIELRKLSNLSCRYFEQRTNKKEVDALTGTNGWIIGYIAGREAKGEAVYQRDLEAGVRACVLCFSEHVPLLSDCQPHDLGSEASSIEVAHGLFDTLRSLDQEGMERIYSEVVAPEGVGLAVMNRLGRAAAFRSVKAEEVLKSDPHKS